MQDRAKVTIGGRFIELHPIYHGCRALTCELARLSCFLLANRVQMHVFVTVCIVE